MDVMQGRRYGKRLKIDLSRDENLVAGQDKKPPTVGP